MMLFFHRHPSLSLTVLGTVILSSAMLVGCHTAPAANSAPSLPSSQTIKAAPLTPAVASVIGDYASEGYTKRAQGYDWVAVTIRPYKNDQINIEVRARSDIKKPTCTFDDTATLMGQDQAHGVIFQTTVNDSTAFFQFKADKLIVDSQDKYALNRFCSGGGSIVGKYQKLETDLELN